MRRWMTAGLALTTALSGCMVLPPPHGGYLGPGPGPDMAHRPPPLARHDMPPTEFFEVCRAASVGAQVAVTTPWGDTITGTCEAEPPRLMFRPTGGVPPTPPPTPPAPRS